MAVAVHSSSPSPEHFFAFQDSVTLDAFVCKLHEAKVTAEANAAAEAEAADRITEFAAFKAARASLDTEAIIEAVCDPPP
jgi:hypothetical protein